MTSPARVAAYRALLAIEEARLDLPAALAAGRAQLRDVRDRGLCAEIVHGTLRWQRALDHVLAGAARTGTTPEDVRVRTVLRLSLYQLFHLDRVPAAAVVDDAVDLVRMAERSHSAGFVNASLRSILRRRRQLTLPPRPTTPTDTAGALAYLGVTHSHPEWLVGRWLDRHGLDAADAWVGFNNSTPAVTLRANTLVNDRVALSAWLAAKGVSTRPTTFAPEGLVVEDAGDQRLLAQPSDRFVIQDEASQIVADLVDAGAGRSVLDLCAAPGGKTAILAAAVGRQGLIVACDVRARRVTLLQSMLARLGVSCARTVHVSRAGALPFRAMFDAVFVDAPCSGLGTVRRDPDVKWRRTADDLPAFARVQEDLLSRAAACVRPGGRLVYATCSSEPEENEQVVRTFLDTHTTFIVDESQRDRLPTYRRFFEPEGWLRTQPFRDGLDAFFAAPLVSIDAGDGARGPTAARAQ